jgi:hypothetical protein
MHACVCACVREYYVRPTRVTSVRSVCESQSASHYLDAARPKIELALIDRESFLTAPVGADCGRFMGFPSV